MEKWQDKKPITAQEVAADIARIAEEVQRLSKHPTPEELRPLIEMLRDVEMGLNNHAENPGRRLNHGQVPRIIQTMDNMWDENTDAGRLVRAMGRQLAEGLPPYGTYPRTREERNLRVR